MGLFMDLVCNNPIMLEYTTGTRIMIFYAALTKIY